MNDNALSVTINRLIMIPFMLLYLFAGCFDFYQSGSRGQSVLGILWGVSSGGRPAPRVRVLRVWGGADPPVPGKPSQ